MLRYLNCHGFISFRRILRGKGQGRKEGRVKFEVLWKESSRFFHVL